MAQVARMLTADGDDSVLRGDRILLCDRDTKWTPAFRRTLAEVGTRVVQLPVRAPNCNAYAERFVRSIKEECLNRLVILGATHLRQVLVNFVAHYHGSVIIKAFTIA
jgi:hypothetical protein